MYDVATELSLRRPRPSFDRTDCLLRRRFAYQRPPPPPPGHRRRHGHRRRRTTTTAAAATAAAAATLALLRFVDAQGAAVEEHAVHFRDGLLSLLRGAHGDEREAARLAGFAIGGDVNVGHFAERREGGAERVRRRVEGEVTYVETISHVLCSIRFRGSVRFNALPSNEPVGLGRGRGIFRAHAS